MAFDVAAFIDDMILGTNEQRCIQYSIYEEASLSEPETVNFFNQVNTLLHNTTALDPNYPQILFLAGLVQSQGIGCPINFKAAIEYYDKSIELKDAFAMNHRGMLHEVGAGGEIRIDLALQLYDQAIALNNAPAMVNKAELYQNGKAGRVDLSIASTLYDRAIPFRNALAINRRAEMYQLGEDGPVNYEKAIALYRTAIRLGNTFAMVNRAEMHEKGQGGPVDYKKAIQLYEKAIRLGDSLAMVGRAILYIRGHDGADGLINYPAAVKLCIEAMNNGESEAMVILGDLCVEGRELKRPDYRAAIVLYEKAKNAGNVTALVKLAIMHIKGQGGPVHYAAAIEHLDKAVAHQNLEAIWLRATMHEKAQGGPQNYAAAAALYEIAIAQGDKKAMAKRAEMYKKGQGGPISPTKYRILHLLCQSQPCDTRPFGRENKGFFKLMTHNCAEDIDSTSFISLGLALKFLHTMPPTLEGLEQYKARIYKAIETQIIPRYPIHDHFHRKIAGLSAYNMNFLFALMWHYACKQYTDEGYKQFRETVSYGAFVASKEPEALNTLKTLATQFHDAPYWLGMYYLNSNRPAGLFSASDKQLAIKCFRKAAEDKQNTLENRELAKNQLRAMQQAVVLDINKPLAKPAPAPDNHIVMKQDPFAKVGQPSVACVQPHATTAVVTSNNFFPAVPLQDFPVPISKPSKQEAEAASLI